MINKLSSWNTFILALTMLFSTICLLPMNLSAGRTDHDNKVTDHYVAQTQTSVTYRDLRPDGPHKVFTGSYANVTNISNVPLRYYVSASLTVMQRGDVTYGTRKYKDDGWLQPMEFESFSLISM